MAKSSSERSKELDERRKELGDEELRHRVRPGTKAKLQELMTWFGLKEKSEAVQLLILNAHALGPEASAQLLAIPRHEITISENVARQLQELGASEAARRDRDEQ